MASRHIPEDIKFEVLLRSNGVCEECGTSKSKAHFDHWFVPFSLCKKHEAWNIRFICSHCNLKKGKQMTAFGYRQENLHTHQAAMLAALKAIPTNGGLLGERQAKVIVAGTASGKTRLLIIHAYDTVAHLAATKGTAAEGSLALIVTPNRATAHRFTEEYNLLVDNMEIYGSMLPKTIPVISGSSKKSELSAGLANQPVIVITAQTLFKRLRTENVKRLINQRIGSLIFDEAQYASAKTFESIVADLPKPELVYASGTIIRHDKNQLPSAPYECIQIPGGRELQIIQDIAIQAGMPEARYTRAKARQDGVIKALASEPHFVSLEDVFGRAGDTHIEGKTLEDFQQEAAENDTRFDPYLYDMVLRVILEIAFDQYKSYCDSPLYRIPGRQLKAIALASTREQAERAARIANDAGWNAVAYYADQPVSDDDADDESAGLSNVMKERLSQFESDAPNTPNLIIQCNTLSIGYDHSQIFMMIPLRGLASKSLMDQSAGRCSRLMRDATGVRLDQSQQPPQCVVALDFGITAESVRWYWEEDTELSQIVGQGGDGGPPTAPRPLALLDGFTSYARVNGQWQAWTKSKETESPDVREHRHQHGDQAADDLKRILEERGHITTQLPEQLMKDGRPKTFADFQQEFNEARAKVVEHLSRIMRDHGVKNFSVEFVSRSMRKPLKAWLYIWANSAINKLYPQLKGPISDWGGEEQFAACTDFCTNGVEAVSAEAEQKMRTTLVNLF